MNEFCVYGLLYCIILFALLSFNQRFLYAAVFVQHTCDGLYSTNIARKLCTISTNQSTKQPTNEINS
jgi:hypothetical protein